MTIQINIEDGHQTTFKSRNHLEMSQRNATESDTGQLLLYVYNVVLK